MRSPTAAERTLLEGAHYASHVRIQVEDADGTYQDISDRSLSGDISQTIDQVVITGSFEFQRGGSGSPSLAPLDETSSLNRDALAAYAPLIQVGRGLNVDVATVANLSTPGAGDWQRIFTGQIDEWRVESEIVRVRCRDAIGATLADRWVEAETEYGSTSGVDIEDVMQAILDDWADGLALYAPYTPYFLITPAYNQQRMSVLDALQALCALIGWVIEPRWDDGTGTFRLTFYEPDRDASSAQWVWGPSRYQSVPEFSLSLLGVRNALSGRYRDMNGVAQQYTVEDATSIAQYGRQWMEIEEGDDSPIDTIYEMQTLLDAAILDLKDPVALQELETFCFWPVQVGDYYGFTGNDVHYSEDQEFGVTGYRHLWRADGMVRTRFRTRGKPAGFTKPWLRRGGTVTDEIFIVPQIIPRISQTGDQASVVFEKRDPQNRILNVRYKVHGDDGDFDFTDPTDGSWSEADTVEV